MTSQPISVRGAGSSVITYRAGGKEYPLHTAPQCQVCNSPYRFEIEQQLISGRTYRRIHESISVHYEDSEDSAPSWRSIQEHYRREHMPVNHSTTRQIIEDRAQAVGKAVDSGVEELVDGITLMETVVFKAFNLIANGEAEPTVRDGLAAAKLLAELGAYDGSSVDQQAYVDAFVAYHETAEQVMGKEEFARFGAALAQNPVLKQLAARYDGESVDTVPGEVEEEASGRDS